MGKTAIAEGIAHRIDERGRAGEPALEGDLFARHGRADRRGQVPGEFEDASEGRRAGGDRQRGRDIALHRRIHTLVGAGKSSGAMDAANILKPALARGELRTIGATTLDEFQKYFEQDKALERRFQKVMVDEPTAEDAISILRGLKDRYENHHQVRIRTRRSLRPSNFAALHHLPFPAR